MRRHVSEFLASPGAVARPRRPRRCSSRSPSSRPAITPQNPYDLAQLDIMDNMLHARQNSAAGITHSLGTDDQGRDMLSAIIYGLRISLAVGAISVVIACTIGASVGVRRGLCRRPRRAVVMRIVDLQLSFPAILVALVLLAVFGRGVDKVIIALVIVQWAYYARTVRGRRWSRSARIHRGGALPRAAEVAHRVPPPAAELPAAADRRRDRAGGARDRARGDAVLPRRRRAGHRALARHADRQRLQLPALRQVLDLDLPGHRARHRDRRHQPRRRPAARRAQPEARASERARSSRSAISSSRSAPARAC